jgi:hypothetical protein
LAGTYVSNVDDAVHRQLAAELFNAAWDLIEKPERQASESEAMIHMAHASRLHWGQVGGPLQWARGEWQLARVYALVGRSEPALFHAGRCLDLCQAHALGAFDRGFGYEALARAHAVAGHWEERERYASLAQREAEDVASDDERRWLAANVASIPRP